MVGNEMEAHSIGPRPKPGKGSPVGLGLLAFVILSVVAPRFIALRLPGVSLETAFAIGLMVALAGGAVTYGLAKRAQRHRLAREAQMAYEMQRNRAAEVEKQIAEMKRKAAKR